MRRPWNSVGLSVARINLCVSLSERLLIGTETNLVCNISGYSSCRHISNHFFECYIFSVQNSSWPYQHRPIESSWFNNSLISCLFKHILDVGRIPRWWIRSTNVVLAHSLITITKKISPKSFLMSLNHPVPVNKRSLTFNYKSMTITNGSPKIHIRYPKLASQIFP